MNIGEAVRFRIIELCEENGISVIDKEAALKIAEIKRSKK